MYKSDNEQINWSISPGVIHATPTLTSLACYDALVDFFRDDSSYALSLATESSSHLAGLQSLLAQPWIYAGGGLGNIAECPLQVCLAGDTKRYSLTFASACVVPECKAEDLAASDFPERLRAATLAARKSINQDIIEDYVTLHERIAQVNYFLGTGWVCGNYEFQWQALPSALYFTLLFACILCTLIGTFCPPARKVRRCSQSSTENCLVVQPEDRTDCNDFDQFSNSLEIKNSLGAPGSLYDLSFWSAWDVKRHINRLFLYRTETACLDGLKVVSILWVISGHVLAIQSSTGPGYANPSSFLPPLGITTTLLGQLLFSSRFAVDTFFCISGFLVVHVLKRRLSSGLTSITSILIFRVLRIMPLYLVCLCFWMYVTPHLGSGPFWYQWEKFLRPCRQFWWSNIFFLNNFIPWGAPTTDTCFYHSWYLAVDVQLFFLFAPWLVLLNRRSGATALWVTFLLWVISVATTSMLTYTRNWSVNTFDGINVALFDREGYSKPHIRAQSYLAGMFAAMLPRNPPRPRSDALYVSIAILLLVGLSLLTVTGAYARRPCNFEESPLLTKCGSSWPSGLTFFYSAFSRGLWSLSMSAVIYFCVQQRGFFIGDILSWRLWTPLAHLSFGAYLIHPILIFAWQLGGREKISFRWFSFVMDFTAVAFVSFFLSALTTLTVEFPLLALCHKAALRPHNTANQTSELMPLKVNKQSWSYGTNHVH